MAEDSQRLEPLKTLHETRSNDQYVEAFVVEIPAKLANKALSIVKPVFPNDRHLSFHHLRRIVTLSHLPLDLTWRRDYDSNGLQTIFLLLPNTTVSWETIVATLAPHIDVPGLPRCFNAIVPRHAPLTAEQAALWSERYWPTIYNPAAQVLQDAPPMHHLRRVQTELDTPEADRLMQIARDVAHESVGCGLGRGTGAVVVNPVTQEIIAAAGDARWWFDEQTNHRSSDADPNDGEGRPEYHALMRVIAMVANKELRRRLQAGSHARFASTCTESPAGQPLTNIEKMYSEASSTPAVTKDPIESLSSSFSSLSSSQSATRSEGYLCSGLDVYLTHEPCVCCAMAMIHSRFRACVFEAKLPASGSLTAREDTKGLAYGLFWRRELNWRVMTFQYRQAQNSNRSGIRPLSVFHA